MALVLMTLGGTFLETLSLGAVLPFLAVLVDPGRALRHPWLAKLAAAVGISEPSQLVAPLAFGFITVALLSGAARLVLLRSTHHMSYLIGTDLSGEVYRRTLYQPFSVHVTRNSSQLISGITQKVSYTIQVFQALLLGFTSSVLAIGITAALLIVDPAIALSAALVFGVSYMLIARASRRRLVKNGKLIKQLSTDLVKVLQEGVGGIREVLLEGAQPAHCAAYRKVDRPLRRAMATNAFLAAEPRVMMESLGVACIAGLAFALSRRLGGIGDYLPVLGALAMGARRLLPAFQQIYAGYAQFVGHKASLFELVTQLEQPLPPFAFEPPPPPLAFRSEIRFDHVWFRYTEDQAWVLREIELSLEKGARVGFVGKTGSGKSTTLDLLMGLLEPTRGRVLVDGEPISGEHGRAWQRAIAHVPQAIFLTDTSVAENIAFGVPAEKLDMERVKKAARIAHIAEFIEQRPEGYATTVGERGVRLSGGQRQRMGIARALYKNARVLVFDEATSALDNATERELMDAIEGLSRDLTILMIAHRLSTVERCDKIVVLDEGRVVASGTYAELLQTSEQFRALATAQT